LSSPPWLQLYPVPQAEYCCAVYLEKRTKNIILTRYENEKETDAPPGKLRALTLKYKNYIAIYTAYC
jgi:hypothetical protein